MQLTILNLTKESLALSYTKESAFHEILALPSRPSTVEVPKSCAATLSLGAEKHIDWATVDFTLRGSGSAPWKAVSVPEDCLWRVYICKVSRNHRKLVVIPRRELASFLSAIPDAVPISSLLLPGTHDTMAFYGWPFSQCQSISTPLSVQFHSGIRLLDIRLTEVNGRLMSFHGVYPQKTSFIFILECLHAFLTSPEGSRETIVVSIKPEATGYNFDGLVHKEISESVGGWNMWFLESRIPALGEVRGKAVMFSRFGRGDEWKTGMGIHPTYWPDSEMDGFTWMCNETTVRTNDWYHIPSFISIPEKVALSTSVLLPPPPTAASGPLLNITYFSASSFPLASPQTVSQGFGWPKWGLGVEGVNTRVARWVTERLSEDEPKIRGWSFIDYYEEPKNVLVPLLIELNYRGRVPGEDGW